MNDRPDSRPSNVIAFAPRASELACPCGSVWFTTAVQFDHGGLRVVAWSESHAVCRECGKPKGEAS